MKKFHSKALNEFLQYEARAARVLMDGAMAVMVLSGLIIFVAIMAVR